MKAAGVIVVTIVVLFLLMAGLFVLAVLPQDPHAKTDRRRA